MRKLSLLFLLVGCYTTYAQKLFISISISEAGQPATPVKLKLSKPLPVNTSVQLYNQQTRKAIAAQLLDSVTLLFMMEEKLNPGDYTYSLITGKENNRGQVTIEVKENGLLAKIKNKPVIFYHTKEAMPPADSPAYYRRSGFIHPLYSPSGKILTDDFPKDHAHQHGIFFSWTSTTFRNSSVDFWNQHSKQGTVEHIDVVKLTNGAVAAQIKTTLRHTSLFHGEVLRENWTITIYPLESYFLIDLESEQQNTTTDTLFLNKYHYGGLAFRGSAQWNLHDKNFKGRWSILTSEGYKDSSANHTHARWVDASGKVDGLIVGATVFNHPSNFRYPQPIRVHPEMPYWTYAPIVDSAFYLAPGTLYRSVFRYYVHDGEAKPFFIEQLFRQWASEPVMKQVYK
jgi:hypothetical protein